MVRKYFNKILKSILIIMSKCHFYFMQQLEKGLKDKEQSIRNNIEEYNEIVLSRNKHIDQAIRLNIEGSSTLEKSNSVLELKNTEISKEKI